MPQADLRLIVTPNKIAGAQRVIGHLTDLVDIQIGTFSEYHKGGFEVNATTEIPELMWPDKVFYTLKLVQNFGYAWSFSGDITEALELSCARFKVQGIEHGALYLENV